MSKPQCSKQLQDYYTVIHKSPAKSSAIDSTSEVYTTPRSSNNPLNHSPPSPIENSNKKSKTDQKDETTLNEVNNKLDKLMNLALKNEQTMDNMTKMLNNNTEKISIMTNRMNNYEQSLTFAHESSQEAKAIADNTASAIAAQAKQIENLNNKIDILEKKISKRAKTTRQQ